MKNILSALFLFFSISLFAQNQVVQDFYDKYNELENVDEVKLQGWLLKLAAEYADETEEEKMLEKISFIRVMIMSEGNLVKPKDLKAFIKDIQKENFSELMQIRDGGALVNVFIREEGKEITDVLALINDKEDAFILLSLEGRIQFSDLNNLNINVSGMDHLKKIPENRKSIPRA